MPTPKNTKPNITDAFKADLAEAKHKRVASSSNQQAADLSAAANATNTTSAASDATP